MIPPALKAKKPIAQKIINANAIIYKRLFIMLLMFLIVVCINNKYLLDH